MAKFSISGLGSSEGMRDNSFTIFPPGEYLFKVSEISINKKEDMMTKKHVGDTFVVKSIVENCEGLPASEDKKNFIGKTYVDFIFVMTPDHPSYAKEIDSGTVGMIGVDTLKSFLDATGNPIQGDSFNEQKSVNKYFEASIGMRKRKDKDGNMIDANKVWAYRSNEDKVEATEEVAEFDEDIIED